MTFHRHHHHHNQCHYHHHHENCNSSARDVGALWIFCLGFLWVFPTYSLRVSCLFSERYLSALWVISEWSLSDLWVCPECVRSVYRLCPADAHDHVVVIWSKYCDTGVRPRENLKNLFACRPFLAHHHFKSNLEASGAKNHNHTQQHHRCVEQLWSNTS